MDTRSLDNVTEGDLPVHSELYESQIECLKDIIYGLKAEIERHDRESSLTRQQEAEQLRKKQDELRKATKDLGELRQFLSTVKTEIDSIHRMMPAPEEAAKFKEKNPHSLNDSNPWTGDEQDEMVKLRKSIYLLEARMEGVLDEAAVSQTENKRLKDELGKARSQNLSLEAKLRDEGHQLSSQLGDLILKVNKNSEVLNLFSDHCKCDVSQLEALHGRLEAFRAELQEIETRVDICAGELQLASVHLLPNFSEHSIYHEGSERRVAKKVRCIIEQGLLKDSRLPSYLAIENTIEINKTGLEASNCTESIHTPPLGQAGTPESGEGILNNTRHCQAISPESHPTDIPLDTIVVASGKTYCQPSRALVTDTSKMIDSASLLGTSDDRKSKSVGQDSPCLETFRRTVLLHPLSAIPSTGNEASLTLKSLLKIETIYSPEIVKNNNLALINRVIETGRYTKESLSKALGSITFEGKQVFGEPWLETYITIFKLFLKIKRSLDAEKGGATKLPKVTEQIDQQQDSATAGAYRSKRVKLK